MEKFEDLERKPLNGGVQVKVFFDNGYGASIVKHQYSYGGDDGLWELAVLKGTEEDNSITYDTDITNDVLGHLTEKEVEDTLRQIEKLNKNNQH